MSDGSEWHDGNPGSRMATDAGCTCAVMDNCHGRGRYGNGEKYGWFVTGGCPVHMPAERTEDADHA